MSVARWEIRSWNQPRRSEVLCPSSRNEVRVSRCSIAPSWCVSFRSLRGPRCPGKHQRNVALFRGFDARFQACIGILTPALWPSTGSLREDQIEGAAGLIDLFNGGQPLFVGCRNPELVDDTHELPDALM